MPMADKYRPMKIEDVVGQSHIIGEGKIINKLIKSDSYPNMIFFGPPGVGKTTVAEILARESGKKFYKINATNSSTEDIKKVINDIGKLDTNNGILLYIDEIQSFNKRQQQSILEFIEVGDITLIASTTENPYHYIYKAILSRSVIFEFKNITSIDVSKRLRNIVDLYNEKNISTVIIDDEVINAISNVCGGDIRSGINILEISILNASLNTDGELVVNMESLKGISLSTQYDFDRDGDMHYDLLSAFQKSIRGSDADASVYYLARLLKGGDLLSVCRRLLIIACEDIGLAYPNAITIVKSCVDSALQVGLPEARIILSQAVILLATSPKSNASYLAITNAYEEIEKSGSLPVPDRLKDAHYSSANKLGRGVGYLYPHDYDNNYVEQDYMPEKLKDKKFYTPQNNKFENNIEAYLKHIKKNLS